MVTCRETGLQELCPKCWHHAQRSPTANLEARLRFPSQPAQIHRQVEAKVSKTVFSRPFLLPTAAPPIFITSADSNLVSEYPSMASGKRCHDTEGYRELGSHPASSDAVTNPWKSLE